MRKNELHDIEELLYTWGNSSNDIAVESTFQSKSQQLFEEWKITAFSEISDQSLRRYFYYQLEGILKISDTLCKMPEIEISYKLHDHLLFLLDHLRQYFLNYFNHDANAPIVYHQRCVNQLGADIHLLKGNLENAKINTGLKMLMLKWMDETSRLSTNNAFTFRRIDYFKYVIEQLVLIDTCSDEAENNLIFFLSSVNFNHLSFFVYRKGKIRKEFEPLICLEDKINYLYNQKAIVTSFPEVKDTDYDPLWPSIKTMMVDWLTEEILIAEKSLSKRVEVAAPKIPLEMSVAHLSCLIRLLYEESVFATQNLQFIFKCFAGHYQSKRQAVISPGSLSKEFYSIDQHTAARVRDLLQRMVQRINRNFFPMAVAINAIVLSYLSMR